MAEHRVTFVLTCINAPSVVVSFEPEGAHHTLHRGDCFRVEMVGPDVGEPEISYTPNGVIVGAWSRAETRVRNRAGENLPT